MDSRRGNEWENSSTVYSERQVESVLEVCNVEIVSETPTHFLCYCPFHGNMDTPAFEVDKTLGLFYCFNPSCENTGSLQDLVRRLKGVGPWEALRIIIKYKHSDPEGLSRRVEEALAKKVDFVEFPQAVLDKLRADFPGSIGEEYMRSRGFEDETLSFFEVGFSQNKNMVAVPMHDPTGMPVGIIGRTPSHTSKQFHNSVNLPKSLTAWNFHRARRSGDTVIVCEASYDAMRVHQAGYPNVIALLGGHVSAHHIRQISQTFSTAIIMTDFDPLQYRPNCKLCSYDRCKGHRAGRDLGRSLVKGLPNMKVMWAAYDDNVVFPHDAKDASDMTDDEIRQCLKGAVSNLEYVLWNPEMR